MAAPKAKNISNERIVAELISKKNKVEAAKALNCSKHYLYERLKDPELIALYQKAKAEILEEATKALQIKMCSAVDTLASIMLNEENAPQIRVNASIAILTYGCKLTEQQDILERLEAIEEAQASQYKGI